MSGLDKLNKQIYETYNDPKNKEILPIVIFFSVIAIIFNSVLFYEMLIWGAYYYYCKSNNNKLNTDPRNLENRRFLLDFKAKILSGELTFKENQ